jgi:hypothetical protein
MSIRYCLIKAVIARLSANWRMPWQSPEDVKLAELCT